MENKKQGEPHRSWYHPDYLYIPYDLVNLESPEPEAFRKFSIGISQMMAPPPVSYFPMMPPAYLLPGQPQFPAPYQPYQPTMTRFGIQPQFSFRNPLQQWTSQFAPVPQKDLCGFCLNAGKSRFFAQSHVLRDQFGVRCPLLRNVVCKNCGATGDNAHTLKFCPWKRNVGGNEGNNNGDSGVSADDEDSDRPNKK